MTDTRQDPLWDVHDIRRTARLRTKYSRARLVSLERQTFWTELVLAATAAGSAVSAFAFWSTEAGQFAWKALSSIAAFLAIAKPLMKVSDKMQRLEALATGYAGVDHDCMRIEIAARQRSAFDADLKERFEAVLERVAKLQEKDAENHTDLALRDRLREEVLVELPVDALFLPPERSNG